VSKPALSPKDLSIIVLVHPSEHRFLVVEEISGLSGSRARSSSRQMQTCREATVLHYAPALDPHLQRIAELANPGVLHLQ
jgi:hypothetical protein